MKYCIDCGCIMPDDHIGDMCECCLDDRGDTIPDGLRKEKKVNERNKQRSGKA